ncbi:cytochrome c5 family protein [Dyella halodurans]|uniref:C-type cytochrome n=1 Tax=Dyella halodurans TaxID=1920171 RepID=A0ABV9C2F1_9GAMM|nr:c-type cytochrome [Dyella halodurans]
MNDRHLGGPLCFAVALLLAACSGDKGTSSITPPSSPPNAEASAAAAPVPPAAPAVVSPGEKVYQGTCVMCHGSPAVGAPVLGNKADWAPRIAQGKDVLYTHALQGFSGEKGAMPAHGGNPSLDDAAIRAAVDFMVSRAQ